MCSGVSDAEEEFYLDLLPWQWLAASNQNFLITERRRHYLRYAGALTFFEINGPSVYKVSLLPSIAAHSLIADRSRACARAASASAVLHHETVAVAHQRGQW